LPACITARYPDAKPNIKSDGLREKPVFNIRLQESDMPCKTMAARTPAALSNTAENLFKPIKTRPADGLQITMAILYSDGIIIDHLMQ
jgi:hypothetical protein